MQKYNICCLLEVSDKQLQVINNFTTIYIHLKLWIAQVRHNLKQLLGMTSIFVFSFVMK